MAELQVEGADQETVRQTVLASLPGSGPSRPSALMAGEQVPDALIAEHGFSVLVTVTKAGREHRFLFDAGTSPDGVTENMRRLNVDPSSIEAIVS